MNDVMQNTKDFFGASNDDERNSPPKKGHGYTGKGSGPGRAPGPSPEAQGRTVVQEGVSQGSLKEHELTRMPQMPGAAYVGDPNAKGANARKVKFGQE